jgi:hypothetical protein
MHNQKAFILNTLQITTFLIFCTPFPVFLMFALKHILDTSNLCVALLSKLKCILRVSIECEGSFKFEALKPTHLW